MQRIGFVVSPGFQVLSLSALGAFEFANSSVRRPVYDVYVLSEAGGGVRSSVGLPVGCSVGLPNSCEVDGPGRTPPIRGISIEPLGNLSVSRSDVMASTLVDDLRRRQDTLTVGPPCQCARSEPK